MPGSGKNTGFGSMAAYLKIKTGPAKIIDHVKGTMKSSTAG